MAGWRAHLRRKPKPEAASAGDERFGRPDSVLQCLEILTDIRHQERSRGEHLDRKTASLLGFAAVTLTLNVTLGSSVLQRSVPKTWHEIAGYSFLVAVGALALGALVAVLGVLRPFGGEDISKEGIDAYADRPKVVTPPEDLRETWLQTVARVAMDDRDSNNVKARLSLAAALLLAVGILGIDGQALTLVLAHERQRTNSGAAAATRHVSTRASTSTTGVGSDHQNR